MELIAANATADAPRYQARSLNYADAKLVWLLSWSGEPNHVIAAKLGTMPSQVQGILSENIHVGSKEQAEKLPPKKPSPYA